MHTLSASILMATLIFAGSTAYSQIITETTVTTTDSASGQTRTEHVISKSTSADVTPIQNFIVVNPLKFIAFYNLTYYRVLSPSITVGLGMQAPTSLLSGQSSKLTGSGVNAEMRIYPTGKGPRGFYIAPNISFNSITNTRHYETYDLTLTSNTDVVSIGSLAGWQWFPSERFAIGLGIGEDTYIEVDNPGRGNILTLPCVRFDVGYAW